MIDLDHLELLAELATPGPWRVYKCGAAGDDEACGIKADAFVPQVDDGGPSGIVFDTSGEGCRHHMTLQNGHFIAAANPAAMLALIAEIRRLRGCVGATEQLRTAEDLHTD